MVNSRMELWRVFRMLGNPVRVKLVCMAFGCEGGVNVSNAAEALGIGEPAASIYLRQLEDSGMLQRSRNGLFVNYLGNTESDFSRRRIADALREHVNSGGTPEEAAMLFGALGNATRISVLRTVARKPCDVETIMEKISVPYLTVSRQVQPLIVAEILLCDENGLLSMLPPKGILRKRIIPLSVNHLLQ